MSGPEVGVADRWLDSFGRDRRSKTVFPEVYHSSIKKNERPAKDFSERPDVQVRPSSTNRCNYHGSCTKFSLDIELMMPSIGEQTYGYAPGIANDYSRLCSRFRGK